MSRRRAISVAAGVISVGAIAAAVTAFNVPRAQSSDSGTPLAATAEIARETLVDREDHDGALGHGDTTTVAAGKRGTVTMLPKVRATITRGMPLCRLDNQPVTLLYGTMPAYRTLEPGVEGSDVAQFEKNLRRLGYDGFTADDEYTSATADAVRDWQDDVGVSETGTVLPSQIKYADGPVRVDSLTAEPGAVAQPGTELLRITGTATVVTVDLDVDDQRLARTGSVVDVTLPDGKTAPGKITGVETVIEPGQGREEDTTKIEVTVAFTDAPQVLDEAAVTVAFTAAQRSGVLTVPVAALLALAEGGYGLQVVDGTATRIVAVETGLFADGKVEVSGTGLRAGMTVAMPA